MVVERRGFEKGTRSNQEVHGKCKEAIPCEETRLGFVITAERHYFVLMSLKEEEEKLEEDIIQRRKEIDWLIKQRKNLDEEKQKQKNTM